MSQFLPRILYLPIKRQWYDMIESLVKKEEYRSLRRYWESRLCEDEWGRLPDIVEFRNGYHRNARRMRFEIEDISISTGNSEWGAEPSVKYYVIKLGERIKP